MRNILNLAGYLAKIEDFEFSLTLPWTIKAIRYCSIPNSEISDKLYRAFGIDPDDDPISLYNEEVWTTVCERGLYLSRKANNDSWMQMDITSDLAERLEKLRLTGIDYRTSIISTMGDSGYDNLKTVKALKSDLRLKVLDQDDAIEAVGDSLVKAFYKPDPKHPKGVLLFLGPPATGKTLLAQCIAEYLGDHEKKFTLTDNFIRIDMSRFSHEQEKSALFGLERFWHGATPGILTSFVRKNPTAVVVLDEFEKAHSKIQTRFLSILNDGYSDDACGWYDDDKPYTKERAAEEEYTNQSLNEKVDFSQTILIFTSNLGSEVYTDPTFLQLLKESPGESEKIMFDTLAREMKEEDSHKVNAIRPEFLSRLRQGRLILFNALSYETLLQIGKKNLLTDADKFSDAYVCQTNYEDIDKVVQALLLTAAPSFDIRGINSHSASLIFDPITDYLMANENRVETITIGVSQQVKKDLESIIPEDKERFKRDIFRKNMSFYITVTIEANGYHLQVNIDSIRGKQIKRAADYKEGGITAELPEIIFDDIAGHQHTKEKLKEIALLLKSYKKLKALNIPVPKGMLMYGPPGTGKTMLAKAFASESELPFISTTGEKILEEEHMKKVFETARLYAPSVIFIDEMDGLRKRGSSGENDGFYDRRTNQMLDYIDGFDTAQSDPVFIIAATNNPDMIDPALLRSGRIDLMVKVGTLDREARAYFIDRMIAGEYFDPNTDKEKIIHLTAGMNGSDLEKLERECSLEAIRTDKEKVTEAMILEQINIVIHGERSPIKRRDQYLAETAYHEAGHAIVAQQLLPEHEIQQITIVPRKNANGFVAYSPEKLQQMKMTKCSIQSEMAMSLAGRAAQMIKYGEDNIDSGASSDLASASSRAHYAITQLGMDSEFENICMAFDTTDLTHLFRDQVAAAMKRWIDEATKKSNQILNENWDKVEKLAQALLVKETIYGNELDSILNAPVKKSRTSSPVNKKKEG